MPLSPGHFSVFCGPSRGVQAKNQPVTVTERTSHPGGGGWSVTKGLHGWDAPGNCPLPRRMSSGESVSIEVIDCFLRKTVSEGQCLGEERPFPRSRSRKIRGKNPNHWPQTLPWYVHPVSFCPDSLKSKPGRTQVTLPNCHLQGNAEGWGKEGQMVQWGGMDVGRLRCNRPINFLENTP